MRAVTYERYRVYYACSRYKEPEVLTAAAAAAAGVVFRRVDQHPRILLKPFQSSV